MYQQRYRLYIEIWYLPLSFQSIYIYCLNKTGSVASHMLGTAERLRLNVTWNLLLKENGERTNIVLLSCGHLLPTKNVTSLHVHEDNDHKIQTLTFSSPDCLIDIEA